jgi:hypothetical protein
VKVAILAICDLVRNTPRTFVDKEATLAEEIEKQQLRKSMGEILNFLLAHVVVEMGDDEEEEYRNAA